MLRWMMFDCAIRSGHPACEGKHLHGRGRGPEGNPQRPRGPHRRPIPGRRQQGFQGDADGRSELRSLCSDVIQFGFQDCRRTGDQPQNKFLTYILIPYDKCVLLQSDVNVCCYIMFWWRQLRVHILPLVVSMLKIMGFFVLSLPVKATLCLPSASLMLTTGSWWASPANPATDTSSSWTTWTPSRWSRRSWWPLCARPPRPVSRRRLANSVRLSSFTGRQHWTFNQTHLSVSFPACPSVQMSGSATPGKDQRVCHRETPAYKSTCDHVITLYKQ